MHGLLGRHQCQIDAKGRVSLPSAFRRAVSPDPLVLLQWQPTHLTLFPRETWEKIRERLLADRKASGDGGVKVRRYTRTAMDVAPDTHGRIRIPEWLRQRVGIDGAILFLGALDRIEVWDPQRFAEDEAATEEEEDKFAAKIFG